MDTRQQILEINYQAIRKNGFQATRTDKAIKELGITKGAFYHYFSNKLEMGYAIIDEIIAPNYIAAWKPLESYAENPIDYIIQTLRMLPNICKDDEVKHGCPLNNLTQEMSALDEGFRKRLGKVIYQIQDLIAKGLEDGINNGFVKESIDTKQVAVFIVASFEGAFGIAKGLQSQEILVQSMEGLVGYVDFLRK